MMPNGMRVRLAAVLPVVMLLLGGAAAQACDTPVYAYTMQMWSPDPYRIFYFHQGAEDPADRDVNSLLAKAAQDPNGEVNVRFESVSTGDSSALASGVIGKVWPRNKSHKLPFHVVVSPRGFDLAAERLTASSAKAMFHSPKREKLADLLCEGKMGVLLLLLGSNAAENESAQSVVQAAVAEAGQSGVDVGVLETRRSEGTEKWFVRQMLAVEDDLNELDHTMLFGAFGRGHIVEPFMGRGISRENVLELIAFMGGPCSCEVKATAPGTDLLITRDWSRAAIDWQPTGYAEIPILEAPEPDRPTQAAARAKPAVPAVSSIKPPAKPARIAGAPKPADTPPKRATPAGRPRLPRPEPASARPAPSAPAIPKPADAEAAAIDEVARGPELPPTTLASTTVTSRPSLTARLGLPFGIAVGVLTFGVVLGGLALMWARREQ